MFFILSKILIYLLNPMIWILAGMSLALFTPKKILRYRALLVSSIILFLFSNPFLLNQFAEQWDIGNESYDKNKIYSCAIVLGGFSSDNGNGGGFFNASADRFIQALKLKTSGKVSNLLIVGGNSKIIPGKFMESVWVKAQLIELNIPDSTILIESNSRNTSENALFSKNQLRRKNLPPPYLLITSAFHMRRSLYTFKNAGIKVVPYPSNFVVGKNEVSFDDFIPQAEVINTWGTYLKEVIGFGIYYVKGDILS
jgi:uncharacterized SAM-binding protein YcdF (DUF218 family)